VQKIPTLFERDWDHPKRIVLNKVTPGCEWVLNGEGVATQKLDGTCCLIRDGKLYKRRELAIKVPGAGSHEEYTVPDGFELVDTDEKTGKRIGWVPCTQGAPEDRWHWEGFRNLLSHLLITPSDGTYELVGPRIQGNPEGFTEHRLLSHDRTRQFPDAPRDFDGLREWLPHQDIEGLVFHHPDGGMAKIKVRDFGYKR
jgi:hypothetical protein